MFPRVSPDDHKAEKRFLPLTLAYHNLPDPKMTATLLPCSLMQHASTPTQTPFTQTFGWATSKRQSLRRDASHFLSKQSDRYNGEGRRRGKVTWKASHSLSFLGIFLQRESNDATISDITASSSSADVHKTSRYLSRS